MEETMSRKPITRRSFLQASTATAGAMVAARSIALQPMNITGMLEGANVERVRFGIIGIGMQGSGLLRTAVALPGTQCVAACDLYDGRHTLAKEIAGDEIKVTRRYHELLENKDIDCLIAAVPDHWHKQVVVDAVNAGKPRRKPGASCRSARNASAPWSAPKRKNCWPAASSAI
jgi:predicted homoserine dehydrogenase-like protein